VYCWTSPNSIQFITNFSACRGYYAGPTGLVVSSDIITRGGVNVAKILRYIFNRLTTVSDIASTNSWGIYGTTTTNYYVDYTYDSLNEEYQVDIYLTAGSVNIASMTLRFNSDDSGEGSEIIAQCLQVTSYQ